MTRTTVTSVFDRAVDFVRPAGGRRVIGQPHVPLLALMAPSGTTARAAGSALRR
ncbi:hypothetical protein H7K45_07295 [Mycobacterium yunnanensis]|uniref:Uncharacterized protein n=1 Tax=Mycobacterium yunnanensis TaxID=368477 RepID=A0A9X2YXA4_9MYCO|nr:hypothetical protein [Mycobacterium yunnanensis]MCV7420340.1 hypothetical protein [Mycobacterium yunnanensis]